MMDTVPSFCDLVAWHQKQTQWNKLDPVYSDKTGWVSAVLEKTKSWKEEVLSNDS